MHLPLRARAPFHAGSRSATQRSTRSIGRGTGDRLGLATLIEAAPGYDVVRAMPPRGEGALFLPAGAKGPALLITANFEVIRAYNTSDAYALGVGFLSDRIAGLGPLRASWPVNDPILTLGERAEVQKRLAALALYDGATDGKVGPKSRDSVRRFQLSRGLVGDGYMSPAVLQALRTAP